MPDARPEGVYKSIRISEDIEEKSSNRFQIDAPGDLFSRRKKKRTEIVLISGLIPERFFDS